MDFGGSGSGSDADPASLLSSGLLFVFVGVLGENMVMILSTCSQYCSGCSFGVGCIIVAVVVVTPFNKLFYFVLMCTCSMKLRNVM